jgi:hypothetical protein
MGPPVVGNLARQLLSNFLLHAFDKLSKPVGDGLARRARARGSVFVCGAELRV